MHRIKVACLTCKEMLLQESRGSAIKSPIRELDDKACRDTLVNAAARMLGTAIRTSRFRLEEWRSSYDGSEPKQTLLLDAETKLLLERVLLDLEGRQLRQPGGDVRSMFLWEVIEMAVRAMEEAIKKARKPSGDSDVPAQRRPATGYEPAVTEAATPDAVG
jgi:hypothetical protein